MPLRRCASLPFSLAALIAPLCLPAQITVSRNFAPFALDDSSATGFLSRTGFVGEVQRGFGSAEDEWAWDVKLAGVLQLYRWPRSALVATAGHELTANPFNSIGFNPRGALWEENLVLVRRARTFDWHIGFFHRCRHEIDNTHPPDESKIDAAYQPTARILSLTGVRAGGSTHDVTLGERVTARGFVRMERYASTTDNRSPRNMDPPFWKRALGAATLGGALSRQLGRASQGYVRGWGSVMIFSRGPGRSGTQGGLHWRTESGVRLIGGSQNGIDLFAGYERSFDDVTQPRPRRSGVFGVGLRFEAH